MKIAYLRPDIMRPCHKNQNRTTAGTNQNLNLKHQTAGERTQDVLLIRKTKSHIVEKYLQKTRTFLLLSIRRHKVTLVPDIMTTQKRMKWKAESTMEEKAEKM